MAGLALRGQLADASGWFSKSYGNHQATADIQGKVRNFAINEEANAKGLRVWVTQLQPDLQWPELSDHPLHDLKEVIRTAYIALKLFDEDYYRTTYMPDGDATEATLDPIDHYLVHGRYSGHSPNPYFDALSYLVNYPDIVESGCDPCLHYTYHGWSEQREASLAFDGVAYLKHNADVAAAGMGPFSHFMAAGRFEGRSGRPDLAPQPEVVTRVEYDAEPVSAEGLTYGTIVLVTHDTGVGGAQKVVQSYANWITGRTGYNVKIIAIRGGGWRHEFMEIAPTLCVEEYDPADRASAISEFIGPDARAVFMNSIASAGLLKYWAGDVPVIAYIHELEKVLGQHSEEVSLLRDHAAMIIGGSEAVRTTLYDTFMFESERLAVVPGFIEDVATPITKDDKRAHKDALGIDPETFLVSACGVMHWRKSPELFIDVAQAVLAQTDKPVHFLWIGGGPDQEKCQAIIDEKGLSDHVTITGYMPDVRAPIVASDLFLLPSEEDPFPLVCLMAAQAMCPIICFADAGGMPELVSQGCGTVVPFMDGDAMTQATLAYLDAPANCMLEGAQGQALVKDYYTINSTGPRLFALTREVAGLAPAVSVVLPNYNYENYLPQRLETIANQTFQDFEVILLDDKSTDGSVSVMEAWAEGRPATRLVVNTDNSGSPFAQWIKGMELAQSDLIWMTEADDFCEPNLLETLLPAFTDRNVFLGYVKSVPVNAKGEVLGDYEDLYLNRINSGRWSQPYRVSDHIEASAGLGIANCIPNGSSVIMRKFDVEDSFRNSVTKMRMCGDWLYYLRAMRGGVVAYENAPLNYHRRHDNTVTSQTEGSPMYFDELQSVRDYVQGQYSLDAFSRDQIETFTTQDLDRFGITDETRRTDVLAGVTQFNDDKTHPSVLFVAPDLAPGGGQMFTIRLANAWVARGGRAVLLNVGHVPSHDKVVSRIDPRVMLIREGDARQQNLAQLCTDFDIDVIHSSIWWADRYVLLQIDGLPEMPWIATMHGCHETFLENPQIDSHFPKYYKRMCERVNAWVHIADKNKRVFDALCTPTTHLRIPNGVPRPDPAPRTRAELGLRETSFVLALVSRGIVEKGWLEAAQITQELNDAGYDVELMLMGEGEAADILREQTHDHVHIYGHVDDIDERIALADVGILPSFFVGESMPLVLLEMMAMGKPIVTTDVGDIPEMIGSGKTAAGVIVPLKDSALDIAAFRMAIGDLIDRPAKRRKFAKMARQKYDEKYSIDTMIDGYEDLYTSVLHSEPTHSDVSSSNTHEQ